MYACSSPSALTSTSMRSRCTEPFRPESRDPAHGASAEPRGLTELSPAVGSYLACKLQRLYSGELQYGRAVQSWSLQQPTGPSADAFFNHWSRALTARINMNIYNSYQKPSKYAVLFASIELDQASIRLSDFEFDRDQIDFRPECRAGGSVPCADDS